MAADSLLKAVHERFTSSGLSLNITGGLWTSEVPEGQELPYCAVFHEGTCYEHVSPANLSKWQEHARLSFHVYGRGAEEAEELAAALVVAYAGGQGVLSMATRTVQAVLPDGLSLVSESVRYRDGSLIYRASVWFDVKISKG